MFLTQARAGRWKGHLAAFNGILWILLTGAPCPDLPEYYGTWGSVYHRLNRRR